MDTKDLRCFQLVYEEGSINKAAGQLFITPQGLSRIIRKLEDEFQTQLFKRTASGTVPTAGGDFLYCHCQELLYQMKDIKQQMAHINDRQPVFRIGFACGTLNVLRLETLLHGYNVPETRLQWEEMENREVTEKLLNHTLDAGFIIGTNSHTELTAATIYTGKLNALVYKGHPFYNFKSISILDLKDQPLISLNEKYSIYHNLIQRCNDFGFVPNIVITTMESRLISHFCRKETGIGIDADIHPEPDILDNIHKIEICDAIPWRISLVHRRDFEHPELISALKESVSHPAGEEDRQV